MRVGWARRAHLSLRQHVDDTTFPSSSPLHIEEAEKQASPLTYFPSFPSFHLS